MNRREFHIGPGAASLMMLVVVLSMSALGMLALMNARQSLSLSQRSAVVAQEAASLFVDAQRSLAALDATLAACAQEARTDEAYLTAVSVSLPEGMILLGREVSWVQTGGDGRALKCTAELAPLGAFPRCGLTAHALVTATGWDEETGWEAAGEMELESAWN